MEWFGATSDGSVQSQARDKFHVGRNFLSNFLACDWTEPSYVAQNRTFRFVLFHTFRHCVILFPFTLAATFSQG